MRSLIVATVVLAALCVDAKKPKWNQLEGYTFEQYKQDFLKTYEDGSEEHAMRRKLFTLRHREAMEHNKLVGRTFNKGINHLSDWTQEEFKRLRGNKVQLKAGLKGSQNMKVHVADGNKDLPANVDYRRQNPAILTAVKDQGHCGSCWAHAATEGIESAWAIATGELFVMSQQQITSCTPNPRECGGSGGCGGAIAELAWDHVKEVGGIQQEWSYPYTSYFGDSHFDSCKSKVNQTKAPKVAKLSGYTKTISNNATSVAEALASVGPLAVSVDASHWGPYENGIFNGCDYAKNISMDHAVQLVGYGHDMELKMDYWIIRNSWNAGWGEDGFMRLAKPKTQECGWNVHNQDGGGCKGGPETIWACGTCGIAWDAIYPNVELSN